MISLHCVANECDSGAPAKGRQAEPHKPYRENETHELSFSWLSWAAVLLVGAYARRWVTESRNMTAILQIIGL